MDKPHVPTTGGITPGLALPSIKFAADQLIRKTRVMIGRIIRAYKGEFIFIEIPDTNVAVATTLQLSNDYGLLKIKELKGASSEVAIDLQNGLYTSRYTLSMPRDEDPDEPTFRLKERTSGEYYIKVHRDGANNYSLFLKKNGEWEEILADTGIGCRVYRSTDQVIIDNSWTAISFNSELYDTDTIHDVDSNKSRLTCKTAGVYTISGHIEFEEDDPGVGYRAVAIKLNGTTYIAKADKEQCNIVPTFSISTHYKLAVNDYVELFVFHLAGHSLNIVAQSQWSSHFGMQRIS